MNMLVFLNRKSYHDLMLILNGIMVALVRLIFIHIFMIFIGLANFGSPFKAGSGPNVQLMKLTTTRTLNIQDLQCTATTTNSTYYNQLATAMEAVSVEKKTRNISIFQDMAMTLLHIHLHQEDYVDPEKS